MKLGVSYGCGANIVQIQKEKRQQPENKLLTLNHRTRSGT